MAWILIIVLWDDECPDSVVARTQTVATRISVTTAVEYIGEHERGKGEYTAILRSGL